MRAMILLVALIALGGCETPKNCDATRPVVEWINAPEYVAESELVTMRVHVSSDFDDSDLAVTLNNGSPLAPISDGVWGATSGVPFATGADEATITWWAADPEGCSGSASHTFRLIPTT